MKYTQIKISMVVVQFSIKLILYLTGKERKTDLKKKRRRERERESER